MTTSLVYASNVFVSDTVTADETNENKTIAVWLDAPPASGTIDVTYTITAGTATQGDDYTATAYTGTLSFGTSDTIKSILIEVQQDEIDEDLETVTVVLSGATGGAISYNHKQLFISLMMTCHHLSMLLITPQQKIVHLPIVRVEMYLLKFICPILQAKQLKLT